jgi:hypothetical protein
VLSRRQEFTPEQLHGTEFFVRHWQLSTIQENHLFCNPKVRYRVHKSPPLDPILRQLNLIYTTKPIFKMFDYTSMYAYISQVVTSLQDIRLKICMQFLYPNACYMSRKSHSYWFDLPNNTYNYEVINHIFYIIYVSIYNMLFSRFCQILMWISRLQATSGLYRMR